MKAGLLNIGEKKVWLKSQQVTVQPQEDWAEVEIYEVYENQTNDPQEVLYYFSLPESAAITGLWLGDTADRERRFPFQVSPRGAAQKVYNSQVRPVRPVDPALLEQVGPRQYRLRAFPVPVKSTWQTETETQVPREMHLWLTYKVMQTDKGWPMPQLGEKRNIFWTGFTKRTQNGKRLRGFQEDWLPDFIPAKPRSSLAHQVDLLAGYRILVKPLTVKDYVLPKNQRFAVILDSSFSMKFHHQEVVETFKWLEEHGFSDNNLTNNDADLYVTGTAGVPPQRINNLNRFSLEKLTFYGTLQYHEVLKQFLQLRGNTVYDAILLLTDEGSYELSADQKNLAPMPAPLWMVHLGAFPPAYDDATLKAIQESGGGVAEKLSEVVQRMATKTQLGLTAINIADGYAWLLAKGAGKEPVNEALQPIAARQLVFGLSQQQGTEQLTQLDFIHRIAKTFQVVTPYSSMIVLVNDEQREALKSAEAETDRFDRKVESGKEQLTKPNNPLNSATVPEPETLGGLVIASVLLVLGGRRFGRRLKSQNLPD